MLSDRRFCARASAMIIPLNTDAPVYHFPAATIGLIIANVVGFVATAGGSAEYVSYWEDWILRYGDGLHPVQWITSNFVHYGIFHLIGNMIFLWGFGLVVEGKLGWWKFLIVYLGIGVTQCALEQTMMLGHNDAARVAEVVESVKAELAEEFEGEEDISEEELEALTQSMVGSSGPSGSAGASAILFGMVAISMVWAPKNELTCLAWVGLRAVLFDVTILVYALFYIGFEVLIVILTGFSVTGSFLHLMGAILGAAVGVVLLKQNWVDCEDWDLFAVLSGNYGPYVRDMYGNRIDPRDRSKTKAPQPEVTRAGGGRSKPKSARARKQSTRARRLAAIAVAIEEQDFLSAWDDLYNLRLRFPDAELEQADLRELAYGLMREKHWEDASECLQEYIECYPDSANGPRLNLANIRLKVNHDPQGALDALRAVDTDSLTESQQVAFGKLMQATKTLRR